MSSAEKRFASIERGMSQCNLWFWKFRPVYLLSSCGQRKRLQTSQLLVVKALEKPSRGLQLTRYIVQARRRYYTRTRSLEGTSLKCPWHELCKISMLAYIPTSPLKLVIICHHTSPDSGLHDLLTVIKCAAFKEIFLNECSFILPSQRETNSWTVTHCDFKNTPQRN